MRISLRLLAALLLGAPSFAAVVSAPVGTPAGFTAGASASIGAAIGSQFESAAAGISLRSAALTLSSLDALRASAPTISDPRQKLAAVAVLGALTLPSAALPQRLAEIGVPKAAADRVVKIAQKLDAAAAKDPAVAAQVAAGRKADQALIDSVAAHPEKVLPADLLSTFHAFMDWGRAAAGLPSTPDAPAVGADTPDRGRTGSEPVVPVDPKTRPQVAFGAASLPALAMPTIGDDISALWTTAHDQSKSAIIAMYNFDDMDMAKSIVAAAKKGQKQIIVGDYSNWFPARMQEAIDLAKKTGKPLPSSTPAMQYIVANLGPNLELYILKGLGSIGINHNKFTVFTAPDGSELLQGGSFNYTKTSQLNHWENVVFSNDADRLAYYKSYHAWLVRRARKYSPTLQPQDPVMDPKDPIPLDPSRAISFHGVPFPKVSGSPNGGTEDWLVKAESLVSKTLDILMFSPFPTPKMAAAIEALLAKKIPVRLIADHSQVTQAGAVLIPLMDKGLQLKTIEGPDVVLNHQPWSQSSKMHEKVMLFDGGTPGAMAKMGDSLNISNNALMHNFENTEFWQGFHAAYMQTHFDFLWGLAEAPAADLVAKLRAEWEKRQQTASAGDEPAGA
jgi:phosphatidylserine/phosphatidylglycerophosphate/cardiolipin synthase-like enzyme